MVSLWSVRIPFAVDLQILIVALFNKFNILSLVERMYFSYRITSNKHPGHTSKFLDSRWGVFSFYSLPTMWFLA